MKSTGGLVPGNSVEEMMMAQPIKISEVASMMRRRVNRNERPMEKVVITRNNDIVDNWQRDVLTHIADGESCIPAKRVAGCFQYYFEGLEMTQYKKYEAFLPKYDPVIVTFWINFLLVEEIDKIHEAGIGVVSAAWSTITGALRSHFAAKRWELVYSKSDVPAEWDRLANDNPHVMNGRPLPFNLTVEDMAAMEEKVRIVLSNTIQPTGGSK